MKPEYFSVDVLMERVPLQNRWADERWQPVAVQPLGEGAATPGAAECIADGPAGTTWRFPRMNIEMHASEAEGFFLNLTSPAPVVFVMWRLNDAPIPPAARPQIVTLSYNEAGRFMDGGERVDTVPMPEPIRAWLAAFVATHYRPEPKRKMKRNDPFSGDGPPPDRSRAQGGR